MNKLVRGILFIGGGLLLCLPGRAQITVTQSDVNAILAPGNVLPTITDNTVSSLDIGTAGSQNNSWDFTNLQISSFQVFRAVAASSSPWIAQHPGATHCLRLDTNLVGINGSVYQYLQLSGTQLINIGAMGRQTVFITTLELRVRVLPSEIVYHLPAGLGTTWATAFTNWTRISLNGDSIGGSLTTHNARYVVDAAGWMRMRNDSRQIAALRIRKVNFYNGNPVGGYLFLSKGGAQVFVETNDTVTTSGVIAVIPGKTLWNNSVVPGQDVTMDIPVTDVLPKAFALNQNYPNPFNPSTIIGYQVPTAGFVSLKVFNMLGEEVATLVSEMKSPGMYETSWSADGLPSGVYFYRMTAGSFTETRRMMVLK